MIAIGSCEPARTILKQANLTPATTAPLRIDNPEQSFRSLEQAIYGEFTPPNIFELKSSEIVSTDWLEGLATVERREYLVSHGQEAQTVEYVFVTPTQDINAPLIISQNFSTNRSVIASNKTSPLKGDVKSMGVLGHVFTYFFGRYIVEPPLKDILDRGYGFVALHPPDYVADNRKQGSAQLDAIFGDHSHRPGALTLWSSLTTALAETLKAETPQRQIIAYGHSRYGKTALLAAAHSPDIDAVIAHQSGTAGASLMRDNVGESLSDVVRIYPHWLTPAAKEYANTPRSLPSDAHALIAAVAPKPTLLGNARRDVWSDPEGAYQAAKWASDNTDQTFTASRLDELIPSDDIVFWTRPGTHGVVEEDWPAFLDFLDAHIK